MATKSPPTQGPNEPAPDGAENDTTKRTDAVIEVMLAAGHAQIAAMTAASRLLSGWAQSADHYAQVLGMEICDLLEGRVPSDQVATRLADAARAYLRELTELPEAAVKHFNEQSAQELRNRGGRTRRARAKA